MWVCGRRYVPIMHVYPMYADVHIRVVYAKKEVDVCLAEVHLFTIDVVYTYIPQMHIKGPFNPKGQKSKDPKSLF